VFTLVSNDSPAFDAALGTMVGGLDGEGGDGEGGGDGSGEGVPELPHELVIEVLRCTGVHGHSCSVLPFLHICKSWWAAGNDAALWAALVASGRVHSSVTSRAAFVHYLKIVEGTRLAWLRYTAAVYNRGRPCTKFHPLYPGQCPWKHAARPLPERDVNSATTLYAFLEQMEATLGTELPQDYVAALEALEHSSQVPDRTENLNGTALAALGDLALVHPAELANPPSEWAWSAETGVYAMNIATICPNGSCGHDPMRSPHVYEIILSWTPGGPLAYVLLTHDQMGSNDSLPMEQENYGPVPAEATNAITAAPEAFEYRFGQIQDGFTEGAALVHGRASQFLQLLDSCSTEMDRGAYDPFLMKPCPDVWRDFLTLGE
jgi:hypothetical protein